MLIITEITLDETILEKHKIREVNTKGIIQNNNFGRGRSKSRDRQYSDNIRWNDKSSSRSRSGSRTSTNSDRIICYKCREYDYFAKDCPTLQVEKSQNKYNRCII